ncbi:hypothetical protein I2486_04950 [Cellulophaga sp. E16_2]|uniref:hypothetical protein n=1 Tax=Cellulophaga sp. E16_2 TaxID=2789297 RepID=UPI001A91BF5D|nr:hypothetical protein [Cellulophaga sp. E16_2]MBO0590749.1 hypothetical protein [Cellulophaga sp. E16_2]
MKSLFTTLLLSSLLFSCVDKNPEVDETKYLTAQKEYEEKKETLTKSKGLYFKENSAAIIAKITNLHKLADSTNTFKEASTDSTLFYRSSAINFINFPNYIVTDKSKSVNYSSFEFRPKEKSNVPSKSAVFIAKENNEFAKQNIKDVLEHLYSCTDTPLDISCTSLNEEELEQFKDISLAFIIEGYSVMDPKLDAADNFSSGLFFASITAIDIEKNYPILKFNVTATNSDQIEYREGGFMNESPSQKINEDYRNNIRKAILAACKKHFTVINY